MIIGTGSSQLEHTVAAGLTMRLYLLDHAGGTVAIELDDITGGSHLAGYSQLSARSSSRAEGR